MKRRLSFGSWLEMGFALFVFLKTCGFAAEPDTSLTVDPTPTVTALEGQPPSIENFKTEILATVGKPIPFYYKVTGSGSLRLTVYREGKVVPYEERGPFSQYGYFFDEGMDGTYHLVHTSEYGRAVSEGIYVHEEYVEPPWFGVSPYRYRFVGGEAGLPLFADQRTLRVQKNGTTVPSFPSFSVSIADSGAYSFFETVDGAERFAGSARLYVGPRSSNPWAQTLRYGDTAYFLYSQPGRLERFDLTTGKWLNPVSFDADALAMFIDERGVFIASSKSIVLYNEAFTSSATVATFPSDYKVRAFVVTDTHCFVDATYIIHAISLADGTSVTTSYYTDFGDGFVYSKEEKVIDRLQHDGIVRLELRSDGTTFSQSDINPVTVENTFYAPSYQLSNGMILSAQGSRFERNPYRFVDSVDETGFNFSEVSGGMVHLGHGRITRFDSSFAAVSDYPIDFEARHVEGAVDAVYLFSESSSLLDHPKVSKVLLTAFKPRPANVVIHNPTGRVFYPDARFVDKYGRVILVERLSGNVYIWDPSTKTYVGSFSFREIPEGIDYLPSEDALVATVGNSVVKKLSMVDGEESVFASDSSKIDSLFCVNDRVYIPGFLFDHQGNLLMKSRYGQAPWTMSFKGRYPLRDGKTVLIKDSLPFLFRVNDDNSVNGVSMKYNSGDLAPIEPFAVSPDGARFADATGRVWTWNPNDGISHAMATDSPVQRFSAIIGVDSGWMTMRRAKYSTFVESYQGSETALNMLKTGSVEIPGTPVDLLRLNDGRILAITMMRGVPTMTFFNESGTVSEEAPRSVAVPVVTVSEPNLVRSKGSYVELKPSVTTVGGARYQWFKNGILIPGAVGQSLVLGNLSEGDLATYRLRVSSADGITMGPEISVSEGPSSRLANISTRSWVASGAESMVAGFVVTGSSSRNVLVRAAGPSLSGFGLKGVPDPSLTLYSGPSVINSNDDWYSDPVAGSSLSSIFGSLGAFPWLQGSKDAALFANLSPGAYTAVVSPSGSQFGVGLVEVYEDKESLDSGRLSNLSTRGFVGIGQSVMIAGFVINGTTAKCVLIRASGPTLRTFGIFNVATDPTMVVYDSNNVAIAANDDWSAHDRPFDILQTAARVGAFPSGFGEESALLLTLQPGAYTVTVMSKYPEQSGVGLVEIYELQ